MCQLLSPSPTFDLGPQPGEVDSLVVAADARGSGVGTALLGACRDALRERVCTHWTIGVLDRNVDAQRLSERVGFRPWVNELVQAL